MDDTGLLLNISIGGRVCEEENLKVKPKEANDGNLKRKNVHSHNPPGRIKKPKSENRAGLQVYSTLFHANPEKPSISVPDVEENRESIFSKKTFQELGLHPYMVSNLEKEMGFTHMTSVQERSIPEILKQKDVLIKSQTGSGKTIAYGVPLIQMLQSLKPKVQRSHGVYALVLVPTRELALQSLETLRKLVKPFQWIVPGYIIGGEKKKSEKARLRKGVNILVATPGRIVDHLATTQCLGLDNIRWLVLDEADRLLDMGFEKDVTKILNAINSVSRGRQNILLSATLTHGVERLAAVALNDPTSIDITEPSEKITDDIASDQYISERLEEDTEESFTIPQGLQQFYVCVPSKLRLVTLASLVLQKCQKVREGKMLIFLSSRDSVEFHYTLFQHCLKSEEEGTSLSLFRLHGSMNQAERTQVFEEFHNNRRGVLLCTDVAARGLDLPEVNWIVQYNTPGTPTDYVHRAGRTARVGKSGQAFLFLAPSELEYVNVLNKKKIRLTELESESILSYLLSIAKTDLLRSDLFSQSNCRTMEEAATRLQRNFEDFVHKNEENTNLARQAYLSAIRAYTTFPSWLKSIFHIRKLHLGHMAKSFGLREAPANIRSQKGFHQTPWQKTVNKRRKKQQLSYNKRMSEDKKTVSEFDSGLETGPLVTNKLRSKVKNKMKKKHKGN